MRRAITGVLRRALRVELQIERPRQLCVPLLLLTARTRALLFPTLELAHRPFARILALVPPRAYHPSRSRRW
jgi:hypothetical protein